MVALAKSMTEDHPGRPVLVISNVPGAAGLDKARSMGIETSLVDHKAYPDRAGFERALHAALIKSQPDVICLAGFMRILSPEFTARWEGRMLNIHPSLLPKYKGLNTHARCLEAGDTDHGCSVHLVTAALDDGPILGQAKITVRADDTADSLAARVLPFEHQLYPAVLYRFLSGERSPLLLSE